MGRMPTFLGRNIHKKKGRSAIMAKITKQNEFIVFVPIGEGDSSAWSDESGDI